MKRAVLVTGAAGLLLAGCGAGPGLRPSTYAAQVCGAIAAYEKTLGSQATAYAAAEKAAGQDPVKLQAATSAFLAQQAAGSATLVTALTRVERPQGSGGAQVQDTFVRTARKVQATFAAQQRAVAGADASNQVTFFQVLDTAQKQVSAASQDLATALETVAAVGSQALNDAFAADRTCSSL